MRRGFTIIELATVLTVIGILAGLAMPRISNYADRIAVRRAGDETAAFYEKVRIAAVYRAVRVRVRFYPDSLSAALMSPPGTTLRQVPGPSRHGVGLTASRSEIMLYPNGLGLGAANTKLVFRRGSASDSLTISRLGRLRRWR